MPGDARLLEQSLLAQGALAVSGVRIEAPGVAVGVAGTEFLVASRTEDSSEVYGLKGTVDVAPSLAALDRGEGRALAAGQTIAATSAGLGEPKPFEAEKLAEWLSSVQPDLAGSLGLGPQDGTSLAMFRAGAAGFFNSVGNSFSGVFSWRPQLRLGPVVRLGGTLELSYLKGPSSIGNFLAVSAGAVAGFSLGQRVVLEGGAGAAIWKGQDTVAYVGGGGSWLLGSRWLGVVDRVWAGYSLAFFVAPAHEAGAGLGFAF